VQLSCPRADDYRIGNWAKLACGLLEGDDGGAELSNMNRFDRCFLRRERIIGVVVARCGVCVPVWSVHGRGLWRIALRDRVTVSLVRLLQGDDGIPQVGNVNRFDHRFLRHERRVREGRWSLTGGDKRGL